MCVCVCVCVCVSLVTPPLRAAVDVDSRSPHSLDFSARTHHHRRPHSDPVPPPPTSDPFGAVSNHSSCPDMSSLGRRPEADQLDRTLTADHAETTAAAAEWSSVSRWSASDYFQRYPHAAAAAWLDDSSITQPSCQQQQPGCHRTGTDTVDLQSIVMTVNAPYGLRGVMHP